MVIGEERMQILKMIESGTISAAEGAELLAAEGEHEAQSLSRDAGAAPRARWMRVNVRDLATGASKVSIRLPVGLVGVGVNMGARFVAGPKGADVSKLIEALRDGPVGKVVEAEDPDNNEMVEISLE